MSLPPDTGYLHRSGHSWHLGRPLALTPPPIAVRSDEQFAAELEERMRRLRGDVPRCEVCDWPLRQRIEDGCTAGNCSYRPEQGSDEHRRIQARRAEIVVKRLEARGESTADFLARLASLPDNEADEAVREREEGGDAR